MLNMKEVASDMNILFITLDSLRYDAAASLLQENKTPNFQKYLPQGWQRCSSPGSFTYAAHHAFFAGFLPTPAIPEKMPRMFAARFAGSETTGEKTLVFDTADIVSGFAGMGFKTVCIGGVGFFNKQTALGTVLPSLFQDSYWDRSYGVTDPASTQHQFEKAAEVISGSDGRQLFLFINVSAIHQPNYFYHTTSHTTDTLDSHKAALEYVDSQLPILTAALEQLDKDTFCIICSDHGTAYGEDGYYGHRIGHPSVWDVPMASFILKKKA
ncbi:STM4013/SEN3800 family hydrolase [Chitinophaga rhizophila]|uniref:STM4013/SEN3800 family hydrolase n=1 Tax=Chitinophaga rhizophila TaxID=2866212 RepID=A0ABS7G695_9BACT|nr:STM4013/SEN3800 family hydrolase [Chitinophaga rhizophila]MBW8683170.1 STM4013/SEN3800 family hydrolase [Chitinophaga rhizophila]